MSKAERAKTSKHDLRKFGVILAGILAIFAGYLLLRDKAHPFWVLGAAAWVAVATAVLPTALTPIHRALMAFSRVSGWIITRLILIALFYAILTPMSMVARLLGKEFLGTRMNVPCDSYWIATGPKAPGKDIYERQF